MKNIKFLAITIAIMAAIFSCQKYEEFEPLEEPVTPEVITSLKAYSPGHGNDNHDTRVALSENEVGNIETKWRVHDMISLFDASTEMIVGEYHVSAIDERTGAATFDPVPDYEGNTPSLDANKEYIAVYPECGSDNLSMRDEEINQQWDWWYGEMGIDWEGGMEHLERACCMKSAPFKPSNPMSFAHEMAMMTIECAFPDFGRPEFSDMVPQSYLGQSFMWKGEEVIIAMTLAYSGGPEGFVKAHIMIPATPAELTGERTVSIGYGDPYSDDENARVVLMSRKTSTPFEAGKHYVFSETYKLADISETKVPEGNIWSITDLDGTAATAAQFEGLRAAINARTSEEPVTLIFPYLTTIPFEALANVSGKFNFRASKVTTLGGSVFSGSANIAKIELPSVTTLGANEFNGVSSLRTLILAEKAGVTSTDPDCLNGLTTSSIDLTTHPDNRDGISFLLADGTKSTPFNTINGQAEVPVTGVELIVEGAEISGCFALKKGETKEVTVKIIPENATNQNFTVLANGCDVEVNGNVATLTAVSDGNELYGYLRVWTEEGDFEDWVPMGVNKLGYTVGMLYPNETNPIGVVYEIKDDFSGGRIVSLDQPTERLKWAVNPGILPGADSGEEEYDGLSGIECMGKIYNSVAYYFDMDEYETTSTITKQAHTFDGYPALKWVHQKNIDADSDFDGRTGYAKNAKGVWFLLSNIELWRFQMSSATHNKYTPDAEVRADMARRLLDDNKDRYTPFVGARDSSIGYGHCAYWSSTPNYYPGSPCCVFARSLKIPYDVLYMGQPQNATAYVRAFMNF